jgi:hypothetical protein
MIRYFSREKFSNFAKEIHGAKKASNGLQCIEIITEEL